VTAGDLARPAVQEGVHGARPGGSTLLHQRTEDSEMTAMIAGVAGSLRRGSFNRMLLQAAGQALPPGVELTVFDRLDRVPPFNEDWEADPAPLAVAQLADPELDCQLRAVTGQLAQATSSLPEAA
jgi:NADPH-dependent FMN reductase